jgi:hypothetical protein
VWEFIVEVHSNHVKQTFRARTDMSWQDFAALAYDRFDKPRKEIELGYKLNGESGMSDLTCESEWNDAIICVKAKIVAALRRAVTMDVKNMVSDVNLLNNERMLTLFVLQHKDAKATKETRGKGKEKRTRDDDIPPKPSPEVRHQHECLVELQRHLACEGCSRGGSRTYCWIEPANQGSSSGGHREMSHQEMTIWAKHIVSKTNLWRMKREGLTHVQAEGTTTKYLLPKLTKYDHPPAKKPKNANAKPEVHIAVNITPTPGTGNAPVQMSYMVADSPIMQPQFPAPTPGHALPARVSDALSTPPLGPTPQTIPESSTRVSLMKIVLDCHAASTVPSVLDLLTLMDQDRPAQDLKYIDVLSEFLDLEVEDVIDVYSLPQELLASFGAIGGVRAVQLQNFVRDKFLAPLGYLTTEVGGKSTVDVGGDSGPVVKVEGESSIVEAGGEKCPVVEVGGESSIVEVGGESSIVELKGEGSIVELGWESSSSIVELGRGNSVVKVPVAAAQTTVHLPVIDEGSTEGELDEEDGWIIKEESYEDVLEWLAGVREPDSDGSQEV